MLHVFHFSSIPKDDFDFNEVGPSHVHIENLIICQHQGHF